VKALRGLLWRVRWVRWWLGWPGYRLGDPRLGRDATRDQNRRILRERHEAREPQRPASGRASIATMRRWGIGWPRIILCLLGCHGRPCGGWCGRCGARRRRPA